MVLFYLPLPSYSTLLSSTGSLPIHMVLFYILLVQCLILLVLFYLLLPFCLYLLYSTTFYWLTAYPYGTLLSSIESLLIPLVRFYLLLDPCLSLRYYTIFYWPTAYPYGTLLPSSGPLPTLLSSTGYCLYL